ncbi:MAG: ATP-binding protein, partial [Candidatus Sumerlaeota bacterium]
SEEHYLQVNSAMETLCALPRRQIIGRRAGDILGSKIGRQIEEQEKQVLREARTVRREMTINPGAECRVVVLTVVPVFDKDTRPIGVSGFARDISSRRQLEDQLRQSQKMEALGQLAGGVAHDFNNLLQTILAHAQFAERHMDDPESSREDLRTILRASESAAALTKQLLTFGRRQEIEARVVDLYEVVDDLMKMVRRVIGEDIDLAIHPRPDDLRYVMADTGQLEQILMNLSVNARDAMPEGGRIAIAFQNATISPEWCEDNPWAKPGNYVMLSFSDNGIGMNEETTRYLFEPFFTTKKEGEGTGLGLSTVYGIVQQHKGLIDVHSREGEGSRFDIYLPAHQKAPEEVVEPQPGEATSIEGSETVLVAEDEVIVRELVERLLEDAGYEVILTSDGQEAVEKFQERHEDIDLVILDAVMPRLSGYAAYCKMHEIDPDVPIFFCSGYAADSLVSSSQTNLPLPPVIQKPYRPIELLKMVRRRIDENKKAASELS